MGCVFQTEVYSFIRLIYGAHLNSRQSGQWPKVKPKPIQSRSIRIYVLRLLSPWQLRFASCHPLIFSLMDCGTQIFKITR